MGELNTMSINFLDPEKCRFYINPNGFTALKTEDKDYRRVRLLRTLPLHRPFEYISVSDMDKNEIGIIRNAADFPPESREIIEKDLAARYYCPQISEIYSIDEKMGSFYFDVSIDGFKKDLRRQGYQPQHQDARFRCGHAHRCRRQPFYNSEYQRPKTENAQENRTVSVLIFCMNFKERSGCAPYGLKYDRGKI